jgi:hypothetical protein
MEHVQGFTGSHWMPPLVGCLRRIAPAAAMVNEFVETTQNTNKKQLLASNYSTFRALLNTLVRISYPNTDPLLSSSMRQASLKCEMPRLELKSSRSFLAIKRCQQIKSKKVLLKKVVAYYAPIRVKLLRDHKASQKVGLCAHSCLAVN